MFVRSLCLSGALLPYLLSGAAAGTESGDGPQDTAPGEFRRLISQLKSKKPEARKAAERQLLGMGRDILARLSDELDRSHDPEVQVLLRGLIRQLSVERLEPILARVRAIAATDDWKKEGWRDPKLESLLTRFVAKVRKVTGVKHIRLPTVFDEVQPIEQDPAHPWISMYEGRRLHVTRGARVIMLKRGILLVDGTVDVSSAEDSISNRS